VQETFKQLSHGKHVSLVQRYLGVLDAFVKQQGAAKEKKDGGDTKDGDKQSGEEPSRTVISKLKRGTYAHAEQLVDTLAALRLEEASTKCRVGMGAVRECSAFHVTYAKESETLSAAKPAPLGPAGEQASQNGVESTIFHGICQSGFGTGSAAAQILPQRVLSFGVAGLMAEVNHVYMLDPKKQGSDECRFLYPYWCHAEKQKLVDIRNKLQAEAAKGSTSHDSQKHTCQQTWDRLCIHVSRAMCMDCEQFFAEVAAHDGINIHVLSCEGVAKEAAAAPPCRYLRFTPEGTVHAADAKPR
jgi:hypothetical protein